MEKYLNLELSELEKIGGVYTAKEIAGQPDLWLNILNKITKEQESINNFLTKTLSKTKKIILTGAGTSAYIAFSQEGAIQRKTKITTVSLSTTHLVSNPADYFDADTPTLLVSYARSGNSPESVAAVELADQLCNNIDHLFITCNKDGELANKKTKGDSYVFLLPEESNDKSLAMTGSYSGMLLSGLILFNIDNLDKQKEIVSSISKYGNKILSEYVPSISEIAKQPFKRAVFLGSGPLFGTAIESHLKLQELTDGEVLCKNESFLGFRHGPKAVVDEETLVVYYFSNNEYVYKYEKDLVNSMSKGKTAMCQVGISETKNSDFNLDFNFNLSDKNLISDEYLTVCNILFGQILGFYKSMHSGFQPDTPSKSGAIARVVEGVIIYPFNK
jgi:tagatose-6-phosphate ketose/aldose isomerase